MKPWTWIVLVAAALGPVPGAASGPELHLMFKPVRSVRVDAFVQVELDVAVTNMWPAPVNVRLTYIGTPSLDARYAQPFGMRDIAKGAKVTFRQMITVPVSETARWEREGMMPRFRVEYSGPAGRGTAVLEAVPAGPPDASGPGLVR